MKLIITSLSLTIILLAFYSNAQTQCDTTKITLEYQWEKDKKYDFYVQEIIDLTDNHEVIGHVATMVGAACPMTLKNSIVTEVKSVTDKTTPYNSEKRTIKIHILEFWINDNLEAGSAQIAFEFFELINGEYQSQGVSHKYIEGSAGDKSKKHQRNIRKGISKALKDFSKSKLILAQKAQPQLDFTYGIDKSLNTGAFLTFNALTKNRNRPVSKSIKIKPLENRKNIHPHIIQAKKKKLKDFIYFDGTNLFLNNYHLGGANYRFMKNMTNGRYLVYGNRVISRRPYDPMAGAFTEIAKGLKKQATPRKTGKTYYVYDLKKGELTIANGSSLRSIFLNNEDLFQRQHKDENYDEYVVKIIQNLNDRIKIEKE